MTMRVRRLDLDEDLPRTAVYPSRLPPEELPPQPVPPPAPQVVPPPTPLEELAAAAAAPRRRYRPVTYYSGDGLAWLCVWIVVPIIAGFIWFAREATPPPAAPIAPGRSTWQPSMMERFNSLRDGCSYAEACEVLGGQGTLEFSSHFEGGRYLGSIKTESYRWKGPTWGSSVTLTFQNDRLRTKSQFGLK